MEIASSANGSVAVGLEAEVSVEQPPAIATTSSNNAFLKSNSADIESAGPSNSTGGE